MPDLSSQTLDKLRTFDTPTICNLIELFDVRPRTSGYLDARIRALFPSLPVMVGYASTAVVQTSTPPQAHATYPDLADHAQRLAEIPSPPVIVLQDLDDPPTAASCGDLMCTTYQQFGAVGLVASGAVRDLAQIEPLGLAVFASQVLPARGHFHMVQLHVPVRVGGVTIQPGDLLHGDRNGVTAIPHAIAADLAAIGDAYVAAERIVLDALEGGTPAVDRLREARRELSAQVGRLRAQVRRQR